MGTIALSRFHLAFQARIRAETKSERSSMALKLECGIRKLYLIRMEVKEVANRFGIAEGQATLIL